MIQLFIVLLYQESVFNNAYSTDPSHFKMLAIKIVVVFIVLG